MLLVGFLLDLTLDNLEGGELAVNLLELVILRGANSSGLLSKRLFRIMRFLSKSRRIAVVILAIIVSPFCACGWFKMLCVLRGWYGHF